MPDWRPLGQSLHDTDPRVGEYVLTGQDSQASASVWLLNRPRGQVRQLAVRSALYLPASHCP